MSAKTETPLTQLREGKLHGMVPWYHPSLLFKVGVRTIVSSVFGQYADQRLVQAATDPGTEAEIKTRYDYSDPNAADPHRRVNLDETGAYWVDYLADTGDGFEPTYTMAYLAALDSLRVNDADNKTRLRLRHGDIMILGGDQCYPQATREDYKKKLVTPFSWAYDVPTAERKLFAIPGNHDWYDGLSAFDSLFCSSRDKLSHDKGERIGGWQCQQHRSYWAMKLPYDWWIWGTDIQFSKFLDSAQVSYFETIATQIKPGDKLILCIAEPSWLLSEFGKDDEEGNFFTITRIARQAGAEVCAVVAGDWHVYARYFNPKLNVHFITAGGGGAFLHPTHVLKTEISVDWPKQTDAAPKASDPRPGYGPPEPGWTKETVDIRLRTKAAPATADKVKAGVAEVLTEAKDIVLEPVDKALTGKHKTLQSDTKCYPGRMRSRILSLQNLFFPLRNKWFAFFIGLIYWLITWEYYALVTRHDISAGAIDDVGLKTSFWQVFSYTPFYLVQGMLVSLPFAFMLAGLWFGLMRYVDIGARRGFHALVTRFVVGSTHTAAHLGVMFALGLMFVQWNNLIAPALYPYANALWSGSDKTSMTGAVARKVLEPITEGRQGQVKRYQEEQKGTDSSARRMAPPVDLQPSATNKVNEKSFRQIVGFVLYPLEIIILGGLAGGFILGLYWVLTGMFLRMHAEQAFAALRLTGYNNFLRFKFETDKLTIYPIGIDKIPKRSFWTSRKGAKTIPSHNPQLIAPSDIPVRLIERPIVIRSGNKSV